jgi:hypothetical protein
VSTIREAIPRLLWVYAWLIASIWIGLTLFGSPVWSGVIGQWVDTLGLGPRGAYSLKYAIGLGLLLGTTALLRFTIVKISLHLFGYDPFDRSKGKTRSRTR